MTNCPLASAAGRRCHYVKTSRVESWMAELPRAEIGDALDCPFAILLDRGCPHIRLPSMERLLGSLATLLEDAYELDPDVGENVEILLMRRFPATQARLGEV